MTAEGKGTGNKMSPFGEMQDALDHANQHIIST